MRKDDGIITTGDLAGYRAIERQPLTARYRGIFDVYVPPSPSSGGPCLVEELNMLDNFDLKKWDRWSPELLHVMTESMRRASCDRARYLGDPAFVDIPAKLATHEYGQELARTIDLAKATASLDISKDISISPEGQNTTHFSVIDSDGMAVANTYTLERIWGTRIVVKDMGFILNNQMRAFNIFPGVTDKQGNVGTAPTRLHRASAHSVPDAHDRRERRPCAAVTGSPGSQAIPNTVLNIIVSTLDYHLPLSEAVQLPRFSTSGCPMKSPLKHPSVILQPSLP